MGARVNKMSSFTLVLLTATSVYCVKAAENSSSVEDTNGNLRGSTLDTQALWNGHCCSGATPLSCCSSSEGCCQPFQLECYKTNTCCTGGNWLDCCKSDTCWQPRFLDCCDSSTVCKMLTATNSLRTLNPDGSYFACQ